MDISSEIGRPWAYGPGPSGKYNGYFGIRHSGGRAPWPSLPPEHLPERSGAALGPWPRTFRSKTEIISRALPSSGWPAPHSPAPPLMSPSLLARVPERVAWWLRATRIASQLAFQAAERNGPPAGGSTRGSWLFSSCLELKSGRCPFSPLGLNGHFERDRAALGLWPRTFGQI